MICVWVGANPSTTVGAAGQRRQMARNIIVRAVGLMLSEDDYVDR